MNVSKRSQEKCVCDFRPHAHRTRACAGEIRILEKRTRACDVRVAENRVCECVCVTIHSLQFSVDKQCSLITSVSNFCYHYQNLLQFTKITTRIHVFWPCLKLHNWCFWSNSTLLSFCAPYRCKYKYLWGIYIHSDMEHIHGRQARISFCSQYRCKYNLKKSVKCQRNYWKSSIKS